MSRYNLKCRRMGRKIILDSVSQTVLDLLANELFHAERSVSKETDWQEVYRECQRQTVTVHGLKAAERAAVLQGDLLQEWKKTAISVACHNFQVIWEHNYVDKLMRDAEIPYVVLKGCASAFYYPEPADRLMGDVDFLVRKHDLDQADHILERDGFIPWEEQHICHIVYRKDMTHLEMHFEPAGIPYGLAGERVRDYLSDVMEQSRTVSYETGQIQIPSAFHHGLILLLHTSHHLLGEGIGLRHLCDWAVFADSFSDEEFCEIFEEKLKAVGLWDFARILTWTAVRWLGCPDRRWTGSVDTEITDALIAEMFEGGNFGRKQEGKVYETYLISSRGKAGVGHSSIPAQAFLSMNEMIGTHWPKARKNPVLLSAGWVFFGFCYLLLIAQGKRPPLHLGKAVRNAVERKKIYRKFALFELAEKERK